MSQKLPRDSGETIFAARHQDVSQGLLGKLHAGTPNSHPHFAGTLQVVFDMSCESKHWNRHAQDPRGALGPKSPQKSQELETKFGESLGGSQAAPSFWEVAGLPRKFPGLPRKFFGDFPGSSLTVEPTSNPEVPRKLPKLPRKFPKLPRTFPDFPGGQPLSLGSLTPSPDSQKLSLSFSRVLIKEIPWCFECFQQFWGARGVKNPWCFGWFSLVFT